MAAAGVPLLVAVSYVAVAVLWTWPLATEVATHTALPARPFKTLAERTDNDQLFAISAAARNAAAILNGDLRRLINWRTCYPTPKAAALGEHAIDLGILALPGYAVTGNPVVAYNTASLLLLLVAGLSTFWVVRHWTGSALGGWFAGLAFAFHPMQIRDLVHPFVIGIHWLPLVLFAFERLLETGRLRFALLLAVSGTLQSWVGAYPLVTFAVFAGLFGLVRLLQRRPSLDARRVLLLALAMGLVAAAAGLVLAQYAGGQDWGVRRRQLILMPLASLLPGGAFAVGGLTVALALLLVGLRGRRPSPVPAVLIGGLGCVVLAAAGPLWTHGPRLPPLYPRLADHLWILGIVRAPAAIRTGGYLAAAMLSGIAVGRLAGGRASRRIMGRVVAASLCALLLVEYFARPWGNSVSRNATTLTLVSRTPDPAILAAYRAFDAVDPTGAVVETPFDHGGTGAFAEMPYYTYLAAYHGRETPACFTSHVPLSYHDVDRMVEGAAAGRRTALVELAAAGLRNLVVYDGSASPGTAQLDGMRGIRTLRRSPRASALRIDIPVSPHHDPGRLAWQAASLRWFTFKGYWQTVVDLEVRNRDDRVWALPHPVRPLAVRTRWIGRDGRAVTSWRRQATMLPLAIAGHQSATIRVPLVAAPFGCECRPEIEIPELGWHVAPDAIATSEWTPRPPRHRRVP